MIYVFLANGFEEMEAITSIDVLRRAGNEVVTVAVGTKDTAVTGAHGIMIKADIVEADVRADAAQAVVLPGGMPGAQNLDQSPVVRETIRACLDKDRIIAAICAAPMVLGHMGALQGKRATCYIGFETELAGAQTTGEPVCRDGNLITGRGPGVSLDFALKIVEAISGTDMVDQLRKSMLCQPM